MPRSCDVIRRKGTPLRVVCAGADLDYAPKLKWVQASAAGMEGMDQRFRSMKPTAYFIGVIRFSIVRMW